jgi:uncharacterized repeat protein (TIGR02543 family)
MTLSVWADTASEKANEDNSNNAADLSEEAAVSKSYQKQSFVNLYKEKQLEFAKQLGTPQVNEKGNGILFTGKGKELNSGEIIFQQEFQFDENALGRVSVDGLVSKGFKASIAFYLDDDETPFVTIPLKRQKKTSTWTNDGETTEDVLNQNISGNHKISIAVITEDTKNMSILLRSVEFVESSLPVIYFNLDESQGTIAEMNSDENHDTECYGTMNVQIPAGYQYEYTEQKQDVLTSTEYNLEYIRGRGNSTWMTDKKPYKLKLEKSADLFGMGKNKHWVLLANRYDNSLMRNKMTYWLGKELGLEYTPECVFVDVVMNGQYLGSYYLCEQVRVGNSRVDIDDLDDALDATDSPTITGGYLLSMEPDKEDKEEKFSFKTTQKNEFLVESPSFEESSKEAYEAQSNYIKNYVQKTEDAIYGTDFQDEDGNSYSDYMDVASAIDYYWVQEISMNGDAFISTSTYLYKKRNGKLYWGPLWDFDFVAWGDYDYNSTPDCESFVQKNQTWFGRLFQNKEFASQAAERWSYIKEKLIEISKDGGLLDQYYDQLKVSQFYDREKWGAYHFDYWDDEDMVPQTLTFKEEKERLQSWIQKRVKWIDENVNILIPKECKVSFVSDGKECYSESVMSEENLKGTPKTPTKKGYVFVGWYDEDGEQYSPDYKITDNTSFEAKWVKESQYKLTSNIFFQYKEAYYTFYKNDDDEYSDDSWYENRYYMPYSIAPVDSYLTNVTWRSSNEKIATVSDDGIVNVKGVGDVTISLKAANHVTASYVLHIIEGNDYDDMDSPESLSFTKTALELNKGSYTKLEPIFEPKICDRDNIFWISTDDKIASVDENGMIQAKRAGKAVIIAFDRYSQAMAKCKVTVTNKTASSTTIKTGAVYTVSGLKYKVTSTKKNARTVACIGIAKENIKSVTIPSAIQLNKNTYAVTQIGSSAFANRKITTIKIGSNVTKIGEKAFYKCKELKSIKITSKKLKTVGKNAIKGIAKKAVIKVPSKKKKSYQKYFSAKTGFAKKSMIMKKL